MRILVLYWAREPDQLRLAIRQHLHALSASKVRHQFVYWNVFYGFPQWLVSLPCIDAIVLHTTLLCLRWSTSDYFSQIRQQLACVKDIDCVRVAVPQDEYNDSEVLDEWLADLDSNVVVSNFCDEHWKTLYPIMYSRATFCKSLTGYVHEKTAELYSKKCLPADERPFHIVYRADRLPYWHGRHGQVKHLIAQVTQERAQRKGLRCDISTRAEDSINGARWLDFLASGRTVIGCESGSSVLDKRGAIRARVEALCRINPQLSFEDISKMMPSGWDDYRFFAISPRHFEAVITKTCQILVEGHYSGVLEPNKHYIPLRRDFSNLDDVLERIDNSDFVQTIAERAYTDIVSSGKYSYRRFAEEIESGIEKANMKRGMSRRQQSNVIGRVAWGVGRARARLIERKHLILRKARPGMERVHMYWKVAKNPLLYTKVCLALKIILTSRTLARILLYYLMYGELRREIRLEWLLEDFLKLGILQRIQVGKCADTTEVHIDAVYRSSDDTLVFRSKPTSDAVRQRRDGMGLNGVVNAIDKENIVLQKVVWDHSAIGNSITYPLFRARRLAISLEPDGVYEFRTLPVFAKQFPMETWQALVPSDADGLPKYVHL